MKQRLTLKQHALLIEALRRFECFSVRRDGRKWNVADLRRAWTGLGTEATYRPAVGAGLMEHATDSPLYPRRAAWWRLTERGARIVLEWHRAGYGGCGSQYEVQGVPPREVRA